MEELGGCSTSSSVALLSVSSRPALPSRAVAPGLFGM